MRKFITIVLCVVLVLSLGAVAFAQEDAQSLSTVPTIGEISPSKDVATGEFFLPNSSRAGTGAVLYASNQISNAGGGRVNCFSNTRTNGVADQISVSYQIQRWNGSSWTSFTSGSSTGYNTANYSGGISRSVTSGYYYRLVTYHYSYIGGSLVGSASVTSTSIYI